MSREPSQEFLRERFDYDPDGHLIYKFNKGNAVLGKRAGTLHARGYIRARIQDGYYLAHRLIYVWHFGEAPKILDHINGVKTDNRIENLRPATISLNGANRKVSKTARSGIKGVRQEGATGRWKATITVLGEYKHLGTFDSPQEASDAYMNAAVSHFGEFARRS